MNKHSGFTLFELILVLALLAVMAAISMPMIGPMFSPHRVTAAGDFMRARWTEMRTRAQQEGRPYAFCVQPNSGNFLTGNFLIEPRDPKDPTQPTGQGTPGTFPKELENVLFNVVEGTGTAGPSGYKTILIVGADGAPEEDAAVSFGDARGRQVEVRMRRVTGAITSQERTQP